MSKEQTKIIKGGAILIMIMHHFLVMPFTEMPYLLSLFGRACKICVAIYAVLSGYGYFFAKEKTFNYGLKKIWGLLKIYWISLFTLFIPLAIRGGWEITPQNLIIQLFGLLPNLNWFAWYVYFYIFCMLLMPIICKHKLLRFSPLVNLAVLVFVPLFFGVILHELPFYQTSTIISDLCSCFMYFPCFLMGYWMAENDIIENFKKCEILDNFMIDVLGVILVFIMRILSNSIIGFSFDFLLAPVLILLLVCFFEKLHSQFLDKIFLALGEYSTGMWFFHAVFFSTYVCDLFLPILNIVSWPPLMFVWLVILSLIGAYVYQKILDALQSINSIYRRRI